MAKLLFALFLQGLHKISAGPGSMTCDYACMEQYTPGATFNYMGIANIGATTGATCAITSDVPSGGGAAGTAYTITVTSTTALAQKLVGSDGTSSDYGTKVTSWGHSWTAPACGSGSISFRALCGAGGSIDEMWTAEVLTVTSLGSVGESRSEPLQARSADCPATTTTEMMTTTTEMMTSTTGMNTTVVLDTSAAVLQGQCRGT